MNPINYLLRHFGSKEQKIRAIEYDMQKNQDEIEYALSDMADTENNIEREHLEIKATIFADKITKDQLELERLKYE